MSSPGRYNSVNISKEFIFKMEFNLYFLKGKKKKKEKVSGLKLSVVTI